MKNSKENTYDLTSVSHLIVLVSYSVLALILSVEALLLGWNRGWIPVLLTGVIFAWYLNFFQHFSPDRRIWIYAALMMIAFFYYGCHPSSMYDMAPVMMALILIFSSTGQKGLIVLCVLTYWFTMLYDLVHAMEEQLLTADVLTVSRIATHFLIVPLGGVAAAAAISKIRSERGMYRSRLGELQDALEVAEENNHTFVKELEKPVSQMSGDLLLLHSAMGEAAKDPLAAQEYGKVYFNVSLLENKLRDINDYSDIADGKVTVTEETYEITELLDELKIERRMRLDRMNTELVVDLDPNVPKALVGDRRKLLRILKHLISNGMRYTKRGGVYLRVYTIPHANDVNLCFEVDDTGSGMVQSELDRILDRLEKQRTGEYHPGGLGLGLFIVNGFVRAMNGVFRIDSKWGDGTRICVSIPQKVANAVPCLSYNTKLEVCAVFEDLNALSDQVNLYYEEMLLHASQGLQIPVYYASTPQELEELARYYKKVCFFVGQGRYSLWRLSLELTEAPEIYWVIIASRLFNGAGEDVDYIIRKPFSTIEVVRCLETAGRTIRRRRRRDEEENPEKEIGDFSVPSAERIAERRLRKIGHHRILITTDSMSDLPKEISDEQTIPVIPFRIYSEHTSFLDGVEVAQGCAMQFVEQGVRLHSMAPEEDEYRQFFEQNLQYADEIIHISTARRISVGYDRAMAVAAKHPQITVYNSGQVSGGLALMVMKACELVRSGASREEVLAELDRMKPKVRTTFLIDNMDYLVKYAKTSRPLSLIEKALMLHPVLETRRDALRIRRVYTGSMHKAKERYLGRILRRTDRIDPKYAFVGYVKLERSEVMGVDTRLKRKGGFENVILRKASAAISLNCGVGTFGVIYVEK
ncbi:MAG: DegV family EDD domain-containing protein [Lachnospiraceae bacterium]|nr:DegV family EDD domain-containing protein [Lachnospiraceae bacterium]